MAKLITPTGVTEVKPENGKDFKLDQLYRLLNCEMIQVVNLGHGNIMILDEEGKCKDVQVYNLIATMKTRGILADDDVIIGNALICKSSELK